MAIYHLSIKTISRSAGRSATGAAAYRAGVEIVDERTGVIHDYTRKAGVVGSEIVLPDDSPEWARDRSKLWNAAETAETRKNSTVAREFEVALPAELSADERMELVRGLCKEIASEHGVAVDASIHMPDREGDQRNHHAHILTSTRRLGPTGFGEKARELDSQKTGREFVLRWRERWAVLSNQAFERAGRSERLDHRSFADRGIELDPTKHMGVGGVAMARRGLAAERVTGTEEVRQDNARKVAERPEIVLENVSRTQAVFTRCDVARELNRHIDDPQQFQAILSRLDASPELVKLGLGAGQQMRFTTREMIGVEARMVDTAEALAKRAAHLVSEKIVDAAIARKDTLSSEQANAIRHITSGGDLACVIGDAGTGKSFAMATARQAWEAGGYRVIGAALSGKAAEGLQEGSGIGSRTLASLELAWKHAAERKKPARDDARLDAKTVLVIDEAGMVGAKQLGRVLAAAEKAGAKVVLVGDDKQLAAIEAGAPFRALVERNGAVEITEIRRQKEAWQREASQDFARGSVEAGLRAYEQRDGIHFHATRDAAKAAVAEAWMKGRGEGSSIILAHANADVQGLNQAVRAARRAAGELGEEHAFISDRGSRGFAIGDRVVFLRNEVTLGVKNGSLGTVMAGETGKLSVKLDGGKTVDVDHKQYGALDHGYAVTIHKAQGVTVDRAYVLASGGMDRSLAYVAMTRHREKAELFAGRDDFRGGFDSLVNRLEKQRPKENTLDYLERRGSDRRSTAEDARAWLEQARRRFVDVAQRTQSAFVRTAKRLGSSIMENMTVAGMAKYQAEGLDVLASLRPKVASVAPASREQIARWRPSKQNTAATRNPAKERETDAAAEKRLMALIAGRGKGIQQRAQRTQTKLRRLDDALSQAYREHSATRPVQPRGVSALLGGKQPYEAAMQAWTKQGQRLERRALNVQRRLKAVGPFAENGFGQAERLAMMKLRREEPALSARVDAYREGLRLERLAAARAEREASEKTRERGPGWDMGR